MRRGIISGLALLLLLPMVASGQLRTYPVKGGGVTGLTSNGTTITSTLPVVLPLSTTALCGTGGRCLGFSGSATTYLNVLSTGANPRFISADTDQRTTSAGSFSWSGSSSDASNATINARLSSPVAATIQTGVNAATAAAQIFKGPDSTGATVAGASLTLKGGAGTSGIANGGALILAGGANSSTGEPGAVRISDGGTKPTCAAGIRGSFWYDAGGAGVADTFEVCAKQAAGDTYAWHALATIP